MPTELLATKTDSAALPWDRQRRRRGQPHASKLKTKFPKFCETGETSKRAPANIAQTSSFAQLWLDENHALINSPLRLSDQPNTFNSLTKTSIF
jgi:hypothetical protein